MQLRVHWSATQPTQANKTHQTTLSICYISQTLVMCFLQKLDSHPNPLRPSYCLRTGTTKIGLSLKSKKYGLYQPSHLFPPVNKI